MPFDFGLNQLLFGQMTILLCNGPTRSEPSVYVVIGFCQDSWTNFSGQDFIYAD